MSSGNNIICFGNPLIDVVAHVDDNLLKKYGLLPDTALFANAEYTQLLEDIQKLPVSMQVGGSVTNTVRVLQRTAGDSVRVTYLGSIGDDTYGNLIRTTLEQENIHCNFQEIKDDATGKCAVLLNNGARTLCTNIGASKSFTINDEVERIIVRAANYVYFSAFFLGVSKECLKTVAKICLEKNKCFILNLGAPFLCEKFKSDILNLQTFVDLLFGNESEALAFAKINNIQETDIKIICHKINSVKKLNKHRKRITIITRGHKTLVAATDDCVKEYEVPNMDQNFVKNTNGAGDAFVGGFLAKYMQNYSVNECIHCGILTAKNYIQNNSF